MQRIVNKNIFGAAAFQLSHRSSPQQATVLQNSFQSISGIRGGGSSSLPNNNDKKALGLSSSLSEEDEINSTNIESDDIITNGSSSPFSDFEDRRFIPPPAVAGFNFGAPPSGEQIKRPSKSDIYSNEELSQLLQIHQLNFGDTTSSGASQQETEQREDNNLSGGKNDDNDGDDDDSISPFPFHDLVLEALKEDEDTTNLSKKKNAPPAIIEDRLPNIRAIATDVDGTLLSSKHKLHPRTEKAILNAADQVVVTGGKEKSALQYFFPATGKTRRGALDSLGGEVQSKLSKFPGVFIQGLYCLDGEGNVVFEKKLSNQATEAAEVLTNQISKQKILNDDITIIGYDGDSLYVNTKANASHRDEIHSKYGEPEPQILDSMGKHNNGFHKLLIMSYDTQKLKNIVRPQLEELAEQYNATVTMAIPSMLELLPAGCSKAYGVTQLCNALNIDMSTELLSIGDAENDAEMLRTSAIGVAVGNACDIAQNAADYVINETNDQGGAGIVIEWCLNSNE